MVQWNDQANTKLLKAIVKKAKLSKVDYQGIAEEIGDGCTPKAIRSRIERLVGPKNTDKKASLDASTTAVASDGVVKSPQKQTKAMAKKRKKCDSTSSDQSDEETRDTTPTRKSIKVETGAMMETA